MSEKPPKVRTFPRGAWLWLPAVLFVGIGACLLAFVPAELLKHWVPDGTAEEHKQLLGSAAQIVLFGLGGVIAVIGVGLSLARHGQSLLDAESAQARENTRRQEFEEQMTLERDREKARQAEAADQRTIDQERDLRSRFVAAVELLSSTYTVKRTAGLHALAGLGDDWLKFGKPNELQVCIDVMCGYLRSPVADEEQSSAEASVRLTGYELIRDHLRTPDGGAPLWQGRRFPLAQAPIWFSVHLDELMLSEGTTIDLTGAVLSGKARVHFDKTTIRTDAAIEMRGAWIGSLSFLRFDEAVLAPGGTISLMGLRVHESARVSARKTRVSGGVLSLEFMRLADDAVIDMVGIRVEDSGLITATGGRLVGSSRFAADQMFVGADSRLWFRRLTLEGSSVLRLARASVEGGAIHLAGGKMRDNARISLDGGRFVSAQSVDLGEIRMEDNATVSVLGAKVGNESMTLPAGMIARTQQPVAVSGDVDAGDGSL